MTKIKKDFSLILWVLVVWIIMIVLVWLINSRDKSTVNFPKTPPKDINFPAANIDDLDIWDSSTWLLDETDWLNTKVKDENKINQEKENQIQKDIIDAINLAWKIGVPDWCDSITDLVEKEKCLNNSNASKASLENNLDYCKKITDIEWKNRCSDNYYNENAYKNNDYSVCKKILNEDIKNNCLSSIILWQIDSSDFKWSKEICNQLKWDNKTYCENKLNSKNDVEILWDAVDSLNLNLCWKVIGQELKAKCMDVINFKIAINNKDISKCELIVEENLNSQCILTLTQIKK